MCTWTRSQTSFKELLPWCFFWILPKKTCESNLEWFLSQQSFRWCSGLRQIWWLWMSRRAMINYSALCKLCKLVLQSWAMQAHLTPAHDRVHHVCWNDIIRSEQWIRTHSSNATLHVSSCFYKWFSSNTPNKDQKKVLSIHVAQTLPPLVLFCMSLYFFVPVLMVTLLCRWRPDAGYGSGSSSSGRGQGLSARPRVWEALRLGPLSQNHPKSTIKNQNHPKHPKTNFSSAHCHCIYFFWYCKCSHWLNIYEYPPRQGHAVWTMEGKKM